MSLSVYLHPRIKLDLLNIVNCSLCGPDAGPGFGGLNQLIGEYVQVCLPCSEVLGRAAAEALDTPIPPDTITPDPVWAK